MSNNNKQMPHLRRQTTIYRLSTVFVFDHISLSVIADVTINEGCVVEEAEGENNKYWRSGQRFLRKETDIKKSLWADNELNELCCLV